MRDIANKVRLVLVVLFIIGAATLVCQIIAHGEHLVRPVEIVIPE